MSAGDYPEPPQPCSRCMADTFAPRHVDARGDYLCDACFEREPKPRTPRAGAPRSVGTRPRLTSRVARGLRSIASLASIEVENGAATEFWPRREVDDAGAALAYLYALCDWADARSGKGEEP